MANILVVDDDPDIRYLIKATLEMDEHTVTLAENGEEAIDRIKKRRFDLVVLDIMMPRKGGFAVLEELRQLKGRETTRVIVVTAKHDPGGVTKEVGLGALDHIAKPFLPSELQAAVERALGGGDEIEERRKTLWSDAQTYGSLHDLMEGIQETEEKPKRRR
ncbi:MAG TPA: response regulator [Actinomycetota bacterium]